MAARKPAPRPRKSSLTPYSPDCRALRRPAEFDAQGNVAPMMISTQAGTIGDQTSPENPCLLEFRNIRIVYDNAIEAIRDVSIAVPPGGIVALLAPTGAGKSTP